MRRREDVVDSSQSRTLEGTWPSLRGKVPIREQWRSHSFPQSVHKGFTYPFVPNATTTLVRGDQSSAMTFLEADEETPCLCQAEDTIGSKGHQRSFCVYHGAPWVSRAERGLPRAASYGGLATIL